MKVPITTNPNIEFLIDESDFERIKKFAFRLNNGYVITRDGQYLHRILLDNPDTFVDHINGDILDNRRCNLRKATRSQNVQNGKAHRDNKSGLKGVDYHTPNQKYRATIFVDGKKKHLGYFKTALEAHEAYVDAAKTHFGEYYRA